MDGDKGKMVAADVLTAARQSNNRWWLHRVIDSPGRPLPPGSGMRTPLGRSIWRAGASFLSLQLV